MNWICQDGHRSTLDFKNEMRMPCPKCGVTVYKFKDFSPLESVLAPQEVLDASYTRRKVGATQIVLAFFSVTFLSLVLWSQFAPEPQRVIAGGNGKALPFVDSPPLKSASPTMKNVISEIEVTAFKASITPQATVLTSFNLENHGGELNDYPSIIVRWKGSLSPELVLTKNEYSHPLTPFTKLLVETELQKPEDAVGIEINVRY